MIRIFFLAATPVDQAHLRVRQEFDELRHVLNSAAQGRRFTLLQELVIGFALPVTHYTI